MAKEYTMPNTADEVRVPFQENGTSTILPAVDGAKVGATQGSPNSVVGNEYPSGAGKPSEPGGQSSTY